MKVCLHPRGTGVGVSPAGLTWGPRAELGAADNHDRLTPGTRRRRGEALRQKTGENQKPSVTGWRLGPSPELQFVPWASSCTRSEVPNCTCVRMVPALGERGGVGGGGCSREMQTEMRCEGGQAGTTGVTRREV